MKHGAIRLIGIACILWLAVGCSTATDDTVTAADVIEPASAKSHDPEGLPTRVESPVGAVHPSSAAGGAGNPKASGTNTNLNPPAPAESTVDVRESEVIVTERPAETITVVETPTVVIEEEPVIVERRTVVETPPVRTTTRTMTRKD